ncbi:SEC1 family transport protein SLY1-like [Trifolium pratense]|uniref:SEC1 family transport protein SLY1-like n=1 Tax=Trifolium pratense TaxID=57577 RepID=A0A2K3PBJ8_TRIPR|nr:SEC1 family transport protein SLY1-like [Trifolium pratense]
MTKCEGEDNLFFSAYLISSETINPTEVEAVETALRESEVDTAAFQYVKKIKSLNVSLASANSASRSNIVDWAEKLYGQSISVVTAGVKNLLSSDRQLALARTVEALIEGRPNPETDVYPSLSARACTQPAASQTYYIWNDRTPNWSGLCRAAYIVGKEDGFG